MESGVFGRIGRLGFGRIALGSSIVSSRQRDTGFFNLVFFSFYYLCLFNSLHILKAFKNLLHSFSLYLINNDNYSI